MKEANIELPVVAIGGITNEDIPDILRTGVNGIAMSGIYSNIFVYVNPLMFCV